MRIVDLTHDWSWHTPGWVGYPGSHIYYTQTFQTNRVVAQRIETSLHVGTHMDAPMHLSLNPTDIASLPLDRLVHEGVIVDISDAVSDWSVIKPHHITDRAEVRRGDVLIYYTGYNRFYLGGAEQDLERYMCMHPGGDREFAEWLVDMEIAWTGFDCGSGDHPMNTTIRTMRPDLAKRYEAMTGSPIEETWPEKDLFVMHRVPFMQNITHIENLGGDVELVLGQRCLIGCFPWKIIGGEASICRVVAFLDLPDMNVEWVRSA